MRGSKKGWQPWPGCSPRGMGGPTSRPDRNLQHEGKYRCFMNSATTSRPMERPICCCSDSRRAPSALFRDLDYQVVDFWVDDQGGDIWYVMAWPGPRGDGRGLDGVPHQPGLAAGPRRRRRLPARSQPRSRAYPCAVRTGWRGRRRCRLHRSSSMAWALRRCFPRRRCRRRPITGVPWLDRALAAGLTAMNVTMGTKGVAQGR